MHLLTGALQPPAKEKGIPRFNTLSLSIDEDSGIHKLHVELTAVRWEKNPNAAYVIDEAECRQIIMPLELGPASVTDTTGPPAAAVDRLTERYALLPFSDQVHALSAIKMSVADALKGPAHEIVGTVISYAAANGQLSALWSEVQLRHGDQPGEANPFEVG